MIPGGQWDQASLDWEAASINWDESAGVSRDTPWEEALLAWDGAAFSWDALNWQPYLGTKVTPSSALRPSGMGGVGGR